MDACFRLRNHIMPYAWGSTRAIAELLGTPAPSPAPQAELWLGAHPRAPSTVLRAEGELALTELIAAQPEQVLGAEVVSRFGQRLPFLFKVLAAAQPLSIQAHPSLSQARAGFARQNAAGLAADAAERSYRDDNHKPELLAALTPFWALCGFRAPAETRHLLRLLELGRHDALASRLEGPSEAQTLEDFLRALLTMPRSLQADLASVVRSRAGHLARAADVQVEEQQVFRWAASLAERYPDDSGVLAPLFLNLLRLEPGQAIFLGPGQLHAYLEGTGLEIMANSDNVLRGGLTPKHVDVDGLVEILSFEAQTPAVLTPEPRADGASVFATPVSEFRLARLEVEEGRPYQSGPRSSVEILLCVEGEGRLRCGEADAVPLRKGESLLLPAVTSSYQLEGEALVYSAAVAID